MNKNKNYFLIEFFTMKKLGIIVKNINIKMWIKCSSFSWVHREVLFQFSHALYSSGGFQAQLNQPPYISFLSPQLSWNETTCEAAAERLKRQLSVVEIEESDERNPFHHIVNEDDVEDAAQSCHLIDEDSSEDELDVW